MDNADDPVKPKKLIALSAGAALVVLSAQAQPFQNLNFESATLSPVPPSPSDLVSITAALPGWTAYLGAVQQSQAYQDTYGHGAAEIDIFGPSYPAAGPSPGDNPGTIDGNYSVFLQAGFDETTQTLVSASIAQYGTIPLGDNSLQFEAWTYPGTPFSVSFAGNNLSPCGSGQRGQIIHCMALIYRLSPVKAGNLNLPRCLISTT